MSNKRIGSPTSRTLEWDQAWQVVSRLASARHEILADGAMVKVAERTGASRATPTITDPIKTSEVVNSEEFARAIVEIEHAAAALRQAEPALDTWVKPRAKQAQSRRLPSIWCLIATLWVSTALVTVGAVAAIFHFVQ